MSNIVIEVDEINLKLIRVYSFSGEIKCGMISILLSMILIRHSYKASLLNIIGLISSHSTLFN